MNSADRETTCRNCRRSYPARRVDRQRWCDRCRQEVVRRATRVARLVAVLGTLVLAVWVAIAIGTYPRFLWVWVLLVVAVYFFLYKLTQRVAFEIIRGRGVPAPEE